MISIALSMFAASPLDMTSLLRATSCLHRLPATWCLIQAAAWFLPQRVGFARSGWR
ncbi:MAG: hypothetical protein VB142_05855 [Burkholderia sp.]